MKSLSFFVVYAMSLAPIAVMTIYIGETASNQILSSLEVVIDILETLNRSLL